MHKIIVILLSAFFFTNQLFGQEGEGVAPLGFRQPDKDAVQYQAKPVRTSAKGTSIILPFIEDFTQGGYYPDTNKWADRQVYINNNMAVDPLSRGVATFDALNADGIPYEQQNKSLLRFADSLTSKPIDLSSFSPADSLYLSFYFQPQGNGFDPQIQDSLMLYFRRNNASTPWTRVWRVPGNVTQPFTQVMIPITDQSFFNASFQFRFVNKASINTTDDTWNIDYIRLAANRNMNDTGMLEVAFTDEPSFICNDYTQMPYHQYLANLAGENAMQHTTAIRNNTGNTVSVNYGYTATELYTNTALGNGNNNFTIPPHTINIVSFPVYTTTAPAPDLNKERLYENKYYLQTADGGLIENDTIIRRISFSNYLSYDDGTAEKSYYLKMFTTLPAKLAIEHRLNVADTLYGIAIYFGRQVPLAYQKYFSAVVYRDIAFGGGTEQVLYQEDLLIPNYLSQGNFWYYKFRKPIPVPEGKFYIGTTQPALGGSDSLYFGLDVHRIADNHVYYNVLNEWKKSAIPGAVMIRPVFGNFFGTGISNTTTQKEIEWAVAPNPATEKIAIHTTGSIAGLNYTITDVQGKAQTNGVLSGNEIDISALTPGMYIVHLQMNGVVTLPKKFIKIQ